MLKCLCVHPGCWLHFWKHSSRWSRSIPVIALQYHWSCSSSRFSRFQFLSVCGNEVDHCMVGISKCSPRDWALHTTDYGVTVTRCSAFPGGTRNVLSEFGTFKAQICFIKTTQNDQRWVWVPLFNIVYLFGKILLHATRTGLGRILNADQNKSRGE